LPIQDFVEISSHYGARRSINGGPYDTYHEGTDFSAYRGSPVLAPASGIVSLAETLPVRGGSVILDHGLGIHTGYYHLSQINVEVGQHVNSGDLLGEVGTTGRSTGNHLHWDLLIGTNWIDAEQWVDSNLASGIRYHLTGPFPVSTTIEKRENRN
jgi:murein DD-endopeptidase MepM/ murein hydrolase activator NlpD